MKQIVRKGRFLLFRATIFYQAGALLQTLQALLTLPLNALQTPENRRREAARWGFLHVRACSSNKINWRRTGAINGA